MKILVLSDSHSSKSFMRFCVETTKPDTIIHLGDYYQDGEAIHEQYPDIPFYSVPGNCDRGRCPSWISETLRLYIYGVKFYITHGHVEGVKSTMTHLLKRARDSRAGVVLYGHTHQADSHQEPDGLWVMNPGSCGYYGGSAGLIRIENEKVISCWTVRQEDLEG